MTLRITKCTRTYSLQSIFCCASVMICKMTKKLICTSCLTHLLFIVLLAKTNCKQSLANICARTSYLLALMFLLFELLFVLRVPCTAHSRILLATHALLVSHTYARTRNTHTLAKITFTQAHTHMHAHTHTYTHSHAK